MPSRKNTRFIILGLTALLGLGWVSQSSAEEIRRDPKGKTGISPQRELVAQGDVAAMRKDIAGARAAYRAAIEKAPSDCLAYQRLGDLEVLEKHWTEAEQAYNQGLDCAKNDPDWLAKLLFSLATIRERQGQRVEAITAWTNYMKHLERANVAHAHHRTAEERAKRLEAYRRLIEEYTVVRERIAARVTQANASIKRTSE